MASGLQSVDLDVGTQVLAWSLVRKGGLLLYAVGVTFVPITDSFYRPDSFPTIIHHILTMKETLASARMVASTIVLAVDIPMLLRTEITLPFTTKESSASKAGLVLVCLSVSSCRDLL